jgi:hypothetical protein
VFVTAWIAAKAVLPAYSHRCSPKKFTQHQLFACLVRKAFLKTDYRSLMAYLHDAAACWSSYKQAGERSLSPADANAVQ